MSKNDTVLYQGEVTSITSEYLEGWVINTSNAKDKINLVVEVNGKPIAETTAEQKHALGMAFSIQLPFPLKKMDVLRVRVRDASFYLKVSKEVRKSGSEHKEPFNTYRSWIENVKGLSVQGWICDESEPKKRLKVALFIDGKQIAESVASERRKDLVALGIGDGQYGFKWSIPAEWQDGKSHRIEVKALDDNYLLRNTPQTVVIGASSTLENSAALNKQNSQKSEVRMDKELSSATKIAPRKPNYEGRLEKTEDGFAVVGWVWNPDNPSEHVDVDVFVDNEKVGTATASAKRNDLARAGKGGGDHGFRFLLPDSYLDGKTHDVDVRIAVNGDALKSSPLLEQKLDIPAPSYEGKMDAPVFPYVRGWAWNKNRPSETLAVEIYINNQLVITTPADTLRGDLAKAGKGDGCKSFRVKIPVPIDPDGEYEVRAKIAHTNEEIAGSPAKLRYVQKVPEYQKGTVCEAANGKDTNELRSGKITQIDTVRTAFQLRSLQQRRTKPTILIPVYNAPEETKACIQSVIDNTTLEANLLLINDGSPDKAIAPLLQSFSRNYPHITVMTNEENMGFTRTVNRGFSMIEGDVILLNSDTQVTPRWLENMTIAAYGDPQVATVTAVSDNAGAFSVPEAGTNEMPQWLVRDRLGRIISGASHHVYPDAPTGNGFCMYIKAEARADVGKFDEKNFPRGYGEENDFCLRALKRDWKHIADDATFVYHERSASFGDQKARLIRDSYASIRRKHPEYDALVHEFSRSSRMYEMRKHARAALESADSDARESYQLPALGLPRVLYVMHGGATGGTPQTNADLMDALGHQFDTFCLDCDTQVIRLKHFRNGEFTELERWKLSRPISPVDIHRDDYVAVIVNVLKQYAIELVHVRHIYKHTLQIPKIAKSLNIPVINSCHDFYYVCPTINLLDENNQYCGGKCTKGEGDCTLPFNIPGFPKLKHNWIHNWREQVSQMFDHVDVNVTTAQDAKDVICQAYPQLKKKRFEVIEHGRDFAQQEYCAAKPVAGEKIRILIPGQLTVHKGAEFIEALLEQDKEHGRLEFHFLGNLPERYHHLGVWHGRYEREEFQTRVKEIAPHFSAVFSVWPETYCHTLSESWACGVPVFVSNLGALKERVDIHGGGWVVNIKDVEASYKQIVSVADNEKEYAKEEARARLTNLRTTATMGRDYAVLYKEVLASRQHFAAKNSTLTVPRIAYLAYGYQAKLKDSINRAAYERLQQWFAHPMVQRQCEPFPLDVTEFLLPTWNEKLDIAFIQRGALDPQHVEAFIRLCRERNVSVYYDYTGEDVLGNTFNDADYAKWDNALRDVADKIIVSTDEMAAFLSPRHKHVAVMSDAIDEWMWFRPLDAYRPEKQREWTQSSSLQLFYLNLSQNHAGLDILKPAFDILKNQFGLNITLNVVGAPQNYALKNHEKPWYNPVTIPPGYEASYGKLVSWLRSESYRWDFALAPFAEDRSREPLSSYAYLYYSALGIAAIYSDVAPYSAMIENQVNGYLVENDSESWCDAILSAANNCVQVQAIAEKSRKELLEGHTVSTAHRSFNALFLKEQKEEYNSVTYDDSTIEKSKLKTAQGGKKNAPPSKLKSLFKGEKRVA